LEILKMTNTVGTMLCFILFALYAIPQVSGVSYNTYHLYNAGDSTNTVACSDGANGVQTKLGHYTLAPMFPYVTAYSGATWNSPNCGRCVRATNRATGRSVYLTVIDQCGPPPGGYDAHFDIAPAAFRELHGDAGVNAGVQYGDWAFVAAGNCKGNIGGSPVPVPNPTPRPPSGSCCSSTIRCGSSWTTADSSCGTACTNNGACGSGYCFKDLRLCPRSSAIGDASDEEFTEAVEEETQFDAAFGEESVEGEYFNDAAIDESIGREYAFDAAVAEESQTASQAESNGTPGWAVALVVLASVVLLALIAVVVQLARMIRQ